MELLISAALLGLGGSLHCAGMCGPLVLLVGARNQLHLLLYHSARLLGYGVVGLLFGAFGQHLHTYLGRTLVGYIVLGFAVVIFMSLFMDFHRISVLQPLYRVFSSIQARLFKFSAPYRAFSMGLATVLLPCGMLYSGFLVSMSAPSGWMGMWSMIVFGIASSPALLLGQELVRSTYQQIEPARQRWIQRALSMIALFFLVKMGWMAISVPAEKAMHHHGHSMTSEPIEPMQHSHVEHSGQP